jgi:hypothetical protein
LPARTPCRVGRSIVVEDIAHRARVAFALWNAGRVSLLIGRLALMMRVIARRWLRGSLVRDLGVCRVVRMARDNRRIGGTKYRIVLAFTRWGFAFPLTWRRVRISWLPRLAHLLLSVRVACDRVGARLDGSTRLAARLLSRNTSSRQLYPLTIFKQTIFFGQGAWRTRRFASPDDGGSII